MIPGELFHAKMEAKHMPTSGSDTAVGSRALESRRVLPAWKMGRSDQPTSAHFLNFDASRQPAAASSGSRCSSPHSHMPSKIGIRDFPRSVREYSTLGGIWGYSSR